MANLDAVLTAIVSGRLPIGAEETFPVVIEPQKGFDAADVAETLATLVDADVDFEDGMLVGSVSATVIGQLAREPAVKTVRIRRMHGML